MSVFNEYFRAEVLSKALLSGPAGRTAAVGLTALWGVSILAKAGFKLLTAPFRPSDKDAAISESLARLKSEAKGFGDAVRFASPPRQPGAGKWKSVTIRGTGWRTGEFEFAFLCHVGTGSMRTFVRRSQPDLSGEIGAGEMSEILGKPPAAISFEDAPLLYSTIRQRYL